MTSPLLSLPAELRNRIYEYALIEPYTISILDILDLSKSSTRSISPTVLQPGLTRTCTQIRNESLAIFYGSNNFEISEPCLQGIITKGEFVNMLNWLLAIGRTNRKALGKVLVCGSCWHGLECSTRMDNFFVARVQFQAEGREKWEVSPRIRVQWSREVTEGIEKCRLAHRLAHAQDPSGYQARQYRIEVNGQIGLQND